MSVSRQPTPPPVRPPRERGSPGPAADPLDALLRQAARRTDDPAVRGWLRALLRGEAASESSGKAKR